MILDQIVSIEQYNTAKNKDKIVCICVFCQQNFIRSKAKIKESIKNNNSSIYCSMKCFTGNYHRQNPIDEKELKSLVTDGLSSYKIAAKMNRSQGSIQYWIKKLNLKTADAINRKTVRDTKRKKPKEPKIESLNKYDWAEIQKVFDTGKTWAEIKTIFSVSFNTLAYAKKVGFFKSRTVSETMALKNPTRVGRKMKEETKQKLSIARKIYLANNPDKCAWKTHNKFKSIPCESIKTRLKELQVCFVEEYQPLLHIKRFFSIDIAFPERKIGFDLNGGQHYLDGKLAPYYQKRHDLIESEGWTLYEIPYHVAMRKGFAEDFILPILSGNFPINYDTKLYQRKVGHG